MSSNPYESPTAGGDAYQSPGRVTRTLKSIDPLQAGKVMGVMYLVFGLIIIPFVMLGALASGDAGAGAAAIAMGFGMILAYAVGGFLGGLVMAFVYNVIAKLSGGIRFELE